MSRRSPKEPLMRRLGPGLILAVLGWAGPPAARADIAVQGGFGPNGDVGFVNSPSNLSISFGGDGQGQISQMDGFVNVAGQNLNNSGSGFGTSAQLTYGPPSGLGFTFGASQPNANQLMMTYQFVNNTGSNLAGFQFIAYINPVFGSTNPDDYATVRGSTSTNGSFGPTSYQVGDSSSSTTLTNTYFGTLNDVNGTTNPPAEGTNVAMALGFNVGTLDVGQAVTFEVLLSDDGSSIGGLALTDHNPGYPGDTLTVSGLAVPAPPGAVLLGLGVLSTWAAIAVRRRF